MEVPAGYSTEHEEFLRDLRDSGEVNMFAASPHLEIAFELNRAEAKAYLMYWMKNCKE